MKAAYNLLLHSGMFWEFHPHLSGEWEKYKDEWKKIYRKLPKPPKEQIIHD